MPTKAPLIQFWNRRTQALEPELVYGEAGVKLLYGSTLGRAVTQSLLAQGPFSKLYGLYQSSALSRHKVERFIRDFKIPIQDFEGAPYSSFNDFFIRKFKPNVRPFATHPKHMAAFCEARYLAFAAVKTDESFPVKGQFLSPEFLMGSSEKARPFAGGPLLIARLCPTDYHRFHFPDQGRLLEHYEVSGKLNSVNPFALKQVGEIFGTNERQVNLLQTESFGKLAYIEVGALCVGKIVQTHGGAEFIRGQEKGYFLFGGSTVIVLGEKGAWEPSVDLLEQTAKNLETLVELGQPIASA